MLFKRSASCVTRINRSFSARYEYDASKKFISNMLRSGRLRRITKGGYTFGKSILVVGLAYKPYYYGLEYALTYYDLWNQQANPTVLTTRKIREGVRSAFGVNYSVRRIPKELFFGFGSVAAEERSYNINVSDVEKTFLDMLYFKRYVSEETLRRFAGKMDMHKLSRYAKKYGKGFLEKAVEMESTTGSTPGAATSR